MTTATLDRPLMDVAQVAKILDEGEDQIRLMVKEGLLGCIKRNSRSIKISQDHIDAYLARFEVPAAEVSAEETEPEKPARNPKYAGR